MAIDLESLLADRNPGVEARSRQAVSAKKRQEPLLQRAPGTPRRQRFYAGKRNPYPPHPPSARITLNQVNERESVVEPPVFNLTNCTLDLVDR